MSAIAATVHKIPKIIHFNWGLSDQATKSETPFYLFAAVATARAILRPDRIMMHYHYQPYGIWWDRLAALVDDMHQVPLPERWGTKPITRVVHMSDFVRMQALETYGGIYLDADTLSVRPIDDFLVHEAVMGIETQNGFCNAIMMFNKDSAFLKAWSSIYADHFSPEGWGEASLRLPFLMANRLKHLPIHVEPEASFYQPKWWELNQIFVDSHPISNQLRILHFWNNEARHRFLPMINDMGWVYRNHQTLFSRIILNAEPEWKRLGIIYK